MRLISDLRKGVAPSQFHGQMTANLNELAKHKAENEKVLQGTTSILTKLNQLEKQIGKLEESIGK